MEKLIAEWKASGSTLKFPLWDMKRRLTLTDMKESEEVVDNSEPTV